MPTYVSLIRFTDQGIRTCAALTADGPRCPVRPWAPGGAVALPATRRGRP